jgi:E3 ubiquitin-protein ligase HUWE1
MSFELDGEADAVDAGGVARECFNGLGAELSSAGLGSLSEQDDGRLSLAEQPAAADGEGWRRLELIGRLLGVDLHRHRPIPGARLTPWLLKSLFANERLSRVALEALPLAELEAWAELYDAEWSRQLNGLPEMSADDLAGLALTCSASQQTAAGLADVGILPDGAGADVLVCQDNVQDYVRCMKVHKLAAVWPQLEALRAGLWAVVPPDVLHRAGECFTLEELDLLLCGEPGIDVDDWQQNTTYEDGWSAEHHTIRAFWAIVRGWTVPERAKLLRFATGCEVVPPQGFAGLRGASNEDCPFRIVRLPAPQPGVDASWLPRASTCFNHLKLPDYANEADMRRGLTALQEYLNEPHGWGMDDGPPPDVQPPGGPRFMMLVPLGPLGPQLEAQSMQGAQVLLQAFRPETPLSEDEEARLREQIVRLLTEVMRPQADAVAVQGHPAEESQPDA